MTTALTLPQRSSPTPARAERYQLDAVSDDPLHVQVKTLTGRHNALTAELLAHLAEVEARGIYRDVARVHELAMAAFVEQLRNGDMRRRAVGGA